MKFTYCILLLSVLFASVILLVTIGHVLVYLYFMSGFIASELVSYLISGNRLKKSAWIADRTNSDVAEL
jgi:hypothetical protein